MNRACSHHVKWSMDDHHCACRPWKGTPSKTVSPGEGRWGRNMELHFLYNITCICVSYLHKSRCLTFCPSVYSSIQECVQYALPMSVYCILYMYTVPRRISAHLVQSGVIVNLHGICTSFHPSITLQYITHTTIQTEPYPQHMNENCKRSMIHAPAKFGQRLEFIIPLFVAPLNKRSATEATTATHQARSADSSGTCLVASLCFTVYSMLSPKTRCFWLLLSVLMMTLCLFIYLVDEKNWNESSN